MEVADEVVVVVANKGVGVDADDDGAAVKIVDQGSINGDEMTSEGCNCDSGGGREN